MTELAIRPVYRHRRACYGFADVVGVVGDRWACASPCTEWDARGLLEHVIGFHEVLLLRPLGVKANRTKTDVPGRWIATQVAIFTALDANWGHPVALSDGSTLDVGAMLPMLTVDVLVHTWDLSKAIGEPISLDPELARWALDVSARHEGELNASGLYRPPVATSSEADVTSRLVALLGRDPSWPAV